VAGAGAPLPSTGPAEPGWSDDTVVVGRLGKPFGVHGELTVEVRTDAPDRRFAPGQRLLCSLPARPELEVVEARPYRGAHLVVTFAGVDGRPGAEALRDALVGISPGALGPAADDEDDEAWWDAELAGLAVVTTEGAPVGRLREVLHPPGGDLLAIDVPADAPREVLVPFVRALVPEVDVAGGRIVIDPPDGLLEL